MGEAKQLALTAEDYQGLQPVLFRALAHLTLQGFVAQPADAQDLIQDFFLEQWDNVRAGYDPGRGPLANYVFGAFERFARPRIIQSQSWRCRLQDLEALGVALKEAPPVTAEEHRREAEARQARQAAVQRALGALPDGDRALLLEYLKSGPRSERMLARNHGLTRYRVRERLVESLGWVALAARAPPHLPEEDWQVACALWRDGRTPRATAAHLGLTADQVQQSRQRLFEALTAALKPLYDGKTS